MNGRQRIDEGLELLYLLRERGILDRQTFLGECKETDPEGLLREIRKAGLMDQETEDVLSLTPAGLMRAEGIIRRHRLAEVLFQTVLRVDERETEDTACAFEHMLSEDACDRVCSFLGHPAHCPHGRAIPPGRCCGLGTERASEVHPLSEMQVGDTCEVVHIRPRHHTRLDRLGAYGLVPGSSVRLHQKKPSFVIQIDETDLALDIDVARDIYVRRTV
jgi:DtxR family transcriptional regulator, Mn-dependent transcriptional regulator